MITSKLSKKSVKRYSLKLKKKKTPTSKKRVVKNMKGGVAGKQSFDIILESKTPNVSFQIIIDYESLKITIKILVSKSKSKDFNFNANILNFNANNTNCQQIDAVPSNILNIVYFGIKNILEEKKYEMTDYEKNKKLNNFNQFLYDCMNRNYNIIGPTPSAPPGPAPSATLRPAPSATPGPV